MSADMVLAHFPQESVIGVGHDIIKTDSRTDKYLFNTRQSSEFSQQFKIVRMIDCQIGAGLRKQTLFLRTNAVFQLFLTGSVTEICCRPADIVNIPLEFGVLDDFLGFCNDRFMTACLDDTSLMEGQRTKTASAETAPITDKAEFNFLDGINTAVWFIARMIGAHIRQCIHRIHFFL